MNTTETKTEHTKPAEIEVLTTDLKRIVANAQKVIDKRSTIPVLTHVWLHGAKRLSIAATDLEIEYKDSIPVDTQWADARINICVPAEMLHKILSAEKSDFIIMHVKENKDGFLVLVMEGNRQYELIGIDSSEYPCNHRRESEYCEPYKISRDVMPKILKAVSTDQTRYTLNGVYFDHNAIIATDGRRAHWIEKDIPQVSDSDDEKKKGYIVPAKALTVALSIQDACGKRKAGMLIQHSDTHSRIQLVNAGSITTLNTEGTYPDWRQVIPASFKHSKRFSDTTEIKDFCKTFQKLADASKSIKLTDDTLHANYNDELTMSEKITIDNSSDTGQDLTLAFNPGYLIEAMDKSCVIRYNDEFKPVTIENADYNAVLMPMRD